MGPWFGWIGGWAIAMTGVLVVGSLADAGVRYGAADGRAGVLTDNLIVRLTVALIVAMTADCVIGTDRISTLPDALMVSCRWHRCWSSRSSRS